MKRLIIISAMAAALAVPGVASAGANGSGANPNPPAQQPANPPEAPTCTSANGSQANPC